MATPQPRRERVVLVILVAVCLIATAVFLLVPSRLLGPGLVYQGF